MERNETLRIGSAATAIVIASVVLAVLVGCGSPGAAAPTAGARLSTGVMTRVEANVRGARVVGDPTAGLTMTLSEGSEEVSGPEARPAAAAMPASEGETQALLDRLPALTPATGDQVDFAWPAQSLPAPRPGKTVTSTFPAAQSVVATPAVSASPLEILRHAPDGDVPLAPNLSVTFNQPMVALTSVEDLAAAQVPVRLEPAVAGRWHWIGTGTLLFEPQKRFPMATVYTATVPAGTLAAGGWSPRARLRLAFHHAPAADAVGFSSRQRTQRRDTLILVAFDQRIDPRGGPAEHPGTCRR